MENNPIIDKENVIGPIDCSPVYLSSVARSRADVNHGKPLVSVLKDSQQDNSLDPPKRNNSPKVPKFFSTPPRQLTSDCKTLVNSWEEIRQLDEEELWIERTQVVIKEEHILYCQFAQETVNNIIENLPIKSMENSDNLESTDSGFAENLEEIVVFDEKEEDVETEVKTIVLDSDSLHLSDEPLEKSVLEDNAFIHSCSDLDITVKEILNDEEAVSPKKLEDIHTYDFNSDLNSDVEKTICPEEEDINGLPGLQTKEISGPLCDIGTSGFQLDEDLGLQFHEDSGLQFDEDSFKPVSGEAFALELDYLETFGSSVDGEHMSDLARQSLYVKFDPLVQAGKSGGPEQDLCPSNLARINPADIFFAGPISGDDLLVMDTPPKKSIQSRVTPRTSNEEQQSSKINMVAHTPVDQLFDFCLTSEATDKPETENRPVCNGSFMDEDSSLVQPLLYSKNDLEKAVAVGKEKLMIEWKEETAFHELEIKEQSSKMERLLVDKCKAEAEIHEMKTVMLEYEQTMAQMIEDREKDKSQHEKSSMEIIQERDQLHHDLNNTEKSFAHLHARFEKLKTAVEGYRKNEGILKKAVNDLQENLKTSTGKYQFLKKHAEEKIHEANVEITRVQTKNKAEAAVLEASLKRERSKNSTLQQNLDQKINENKELTAICDELISKVGPIS